MRINGPPEYIWEHLSLYLFIRDFEKSQNKCKQFNIQFKFLIRMTCSCANMVGAACANYFIQSHRIFFVFFLFSI